MAQEPSFQRLNMSRCSDSALQYCRDRRKAAELSCLELDKSILVKIEVIGFWGWDFWRPRTLTLPEG
jgi:hypothetical protein